MHYTYMPIDQMFKLYRTLFYVSKYFTRTSYFVLTKKALLYFVPGINYTLFCAWQTFHTFVAVFLLKRLYFRISQSV